VPGDPRCSRAGTLFKILGDIDPVGNLRNECHHGRSRLQSRWEWADSWRAPTARRPGHSAPRAPPRRWDEGRRFFLRSELGAALFDLYGIARDHVAYILDTFSIVKRNDEVLEGEYRTKRLILEIYDALQRAIDTGESYPTILNPPPADPRVAHDILPSVPPLGPKPARSAAPASPKEVP